MVGDFKSILDLVKAFPTEQECIEHLEKLRWNGTVVSPFDESSKVYVCSNNRYKCKNTGKYFNVKVGTIFEDTKIPLIKWFMALYIFSSHKKGISSHQLAKDIDVTQKTAWFLLHRLRYAFDHPSFKKELSNVVEIDETYVGGEEKNKHEWKKVKGTQGRSTKTKKPVLGMLERDGNIIAQVVPDTKQATVEPIIAANVKCDSKVMTDEWQAYNKLNANYDHERVNHGAKQFVNGMAHTNGVENFWSHFKRTIEGTYHWVSVKHLQTYVTESTYRFNSRDFTTSQRFNVVLENVAGRLTYKELISNEKAC
jgi:transposase-like protein